MKNKNAITRRPAAELAAAPAALSVESTVVPETSPTKKATMSTCTACPYCDSTDFVKRGTRQKKHEVVQLYLCSNTACGRTFTAERVKGKRFPLAVILEGISYYNLGLTLEQTCKILEQKFPDVAAPTAATLASWVEEYKPICRFERMRPYAVKLFPPQKMVEVVSMAHRQLYRFRYHRAKTLLSMEEFKNRRFGRLKEYLDAVSSETPHQYFADGARMSEIRSKFDKTDMVVKSKSNFANMTAEFVLRSVTENKGRHEALQRFMIANDSVTIATEVPVYIRREDVEHMENELKFKILGEDGLVFKGDKSEGKSAAGAKAMSARGRLLTGHIDFVQIRNGMVHILDYKPNASKERPIEQLTWYALALSRLTGLRLFEFKCAWFDDKDFYEFYPLHIVKKLQPKKRARKVHYRDGSVAVVPREDVFKVV
ncbi:MAG: transposase [Minisyncoccota bacterium]